MSRRGLPDRLDDRTRRGLNDRERFERPVKPKTWGRWTKEKNITLCVEHKIANRHWAGVLATPGFLIFVDINTMHPVSAVGKGQITSIRRECRRRIYNVSRSADGLSRGGIERADVRAI